MVMFLEALLLALLAVTAVAAPLTTLSHSSIRSSPSHTVPKTPSLSYFPTPSVTILGTPVSRHSSPSGVSSTKKTSATHSSKASSHTTSLHSTHHTSPSPAVHIVTVTATPTSHAPIHTPVSSTTFLTNAPGDHVRRAYTSPSPSVPMLDLLYSIPGVAHGDRARGLPSVKNELQEPYVALEYTEEHKIQVQHERREHEYEKIQQQSVDPVFNDLATMLGQYPSDAAPAASALPSPLPPSALDAAEGDNFKKVGTE